MDEVILLLLLYPCWIRISRFRSSPGWRSWFPEKPIIISWKTRFSTTTQHVFSVKLNQTFKSILQSDFYPNWTTYSRLRTEPGRLPGAHACHTKWHSFWTDPTKSVNGGCRELLGNQTGGILQGNSIIFTILHIVLGVGRFRPFLHIVLYKVNPLLYLSCIFWVRWSLCLCNVTDQIHYYLAGGLEFGTFFPYIGKNNPNWLSYFSEALKPPTRYVLCKFM